MEEAEERPYPEDPSDWPAPHQITDTFRQNMTKTGIFKCPDGPYPDMRRLTGDFKKPTVIAYYQMGRDLSKTGCYIPRKLHEISNHHTDAYLSSFSMFFFIHHIHIYTEYNQQ